MENFYTNCNEKFKETLKLKFFSEKIKNNERNTIEGITKQIKYKENEI